MTRPSRVNPYGSTRPKRASEGRLAAASESVGLLDREMEAVLQDFWEFNTVEARAAFADKWLRLVSRNLNRTWPTVYQLFKIVQDKSLYNSPEHLEDQKVYTSFEEYFCAVMGKPFDTWGELERKYHYVEQSKPELFKGTSYTQATYSQALAADPDVTEVGSHGGAREGAGRPANGAMEPVDDPPDIQPYIVRLNNQKPEYGNHADYIVRRLKRDHKDIALALARGEFRSARAAGKAAGFIKDPTPLQLAQYAWRKATTNERDGIIQWMLAEIAKGDHNGR